MAEPDHGPGLADVRATAERLLDGAPEAPGLDEQLVALIGLAVASSPTTLDNEGTALHARRALELGVPPEQLIETVVLTSALGAHALHEGGRVLLGVLEQAGVAPELGGPARERMQQILGDHYWQRLDGELPGFVEALLRLSPPAFEAFVDFCAVPWRTGTLPARVKELIYVAIDSTPSHRYLPGLRLHIRNALDLGATRQQVLEVIEIAAAAGPSRGVA